MFTGIVEETGHVTALKELPGGIRLTLLARVAAEGMKLGDSLAVNGCCLTLVARRKKRGGAELDFDLLRETWEKTSFRQCGEGSLVNLERPLAVDGRLHGHFVSGHVDGVGTVEAFGQVGADWRLRINVPSALRRWVAYKGSIAVDGISLTVAKVLPKGVELWIIPHTRAVTNLSQRQAGETVNLEMDLLAKYVERLAPRGAKKR